LFSRTVSLHLARVGERNVVGGNWRNRSRGAKAKKVPLTGPRPGREGQESALTEPRPGRGGQESALILPRPGHGGQESALHGPRPGRGGQKSALTGPRPGREGQESALTGPRPMLDPQHFQIISRSYSYNYRRRFSDIESLILVDLYDFSYKRSSFESEPS